MEPPGSPWFPAAMATLGIAHALSGAAEVAVKELDLAARLGREAQRPAPATSLAEMSLLAAQQDDWPDAEQWAGQAIAAARFRLEEARGHLAGLSPNALISA